MSSSKPPLPHERRVHTRYAISLSAELTLANGRTFTAVTKDISEGGCCITSAYPLPEQATVQVRLFLVVDGIEDASNPPLGTGAHVQWTAESEEAPLNQRHVSGLQFSDLSQAQTEWLKGVIARAT